MNSRQRVLAALEHRRADRVPLDLGGTHVSTIHVVAYRNLCEYLGIDPEPIQFCDVIQQVVRPKDELLERFGVDTRGLFPLCSHNTGFDDVRDVGEAWEHTDEWGMTHRLAKQNGWWWSQVGHPLGGATLDRDALADYHWPRADDPARIAGLADAAEAYRRAGKVVMCKSFCAGLFEMPQRLRGMDNFLCDLLADPSAAEAILDKLLELKIRFWDMTLGQLGDLIDIVVETDDYGTQESQLISPQLFGKLIRPRLAELIAFLKDRLAACKGGGERGYVLLHSCGNVRPLLEDFIEMGVDIINPVHVSAEGMDPAGLKRDFGERICFWGGGVETQRILPTGTPQQVRDDVRRNVEALKDGGGFVFATVHNIQAEVPPQNIMAMWEALREFGRYD